MSVKMISAELQQLASKTKAFDLQRFFQTGPGQYGEGDIFIGVTVPNIRKIAAKHKDLSISGISSLLGSPIHEERMCALVILTSQYKKLKEPKEKKKFYNLFVSNIKQGNINNWDLIDVHAPTIGNYLIETNDPLKVLTKFAHSKNIWERRVAIIFTFAFTRVGQVDLTFQIAQLLLKDKHDLIHKAVGWMLREAGKKDVMMLKNFLRDNSKEMPRTMLRYSIEKLPENERRKWLIDSRN
jgi:3-methyladenine DNA glycosylase AlkD